MTPEEAAVKILDTMLGHLGFAATMEVQEGEEGPCLQIHTAQSGAFARPRRASGWMTCSIWSTGLCGGIFRRPRGSRSTASTTGRSSEDQLIEEVRGLAERVKASGKPFRCGR